jgi:hypothetical protein
MSDDDRPGRVRPRSDALTVTTFNHPEGGEALLVLNPFQTERHLGYVLRRDSEGTWRCGCWKARYGTHRQCIHQVAACRWERRDTSVSRT